MAQEGHQPVNRLYPPRGHSAYLQLTELRRALERHAALLQHGRVLDYGCSRQPYKSLCRDAEYVGADFPDNPRATIHLEDATGRLPRDCGGFDCVLSTQVLEHVTDVQLYLSECARVLKPGGTLLLSTHGIWQYHQAPTDRTRWTHEGLAAIIEAAGFETRAVDPVATGVRSWTQITLLFLDLRYGTRRWFPGLCWLLNTVADLTRPNGMVPAQYDLPVCYLYVGRRTTCPP